MAVAVIQHGDAAPPGLLAEHLPAGSVVVRPDLGSPFPDPGDVDGLVVLGGLMGAYDVDAHPWLVAEKALLRRAVENDVPVLGICLGCQLLADALGGAAYPAPKPELRFAPCELTPAGGRDPVAQHLAEPTLSFHQDTWDRPPGSVLLATSPDHPQAFRLGSALGIQPHPEATPEIVRGWFERFDPGRLAASGGDTRAVLAAMDAGRAASIATAGHLFTTWLAAVAPGPPAPAPRPT